jgi:hypothetical protein
MNPKHMQRKINLEYTCIEGTRGELKIAADLAIWSGESGLNLRENLIGLLDLTIFCFIKQLHFS